MFGTTTVDGHTAAVTFAHHNRPTPLADLSHERITRQPILGGLINEYERAG
jgi:hypothetical protein